MPELALVLRATLIELFLLSGILKLLGFGEFRSAVEDYRVLPVSAAPWAAVAVVVAELAIPIGLLVGGTASQLSCLLLLALLASTSGTMVINLRRGRRIRCGCFGAGSRALVSWSSVGRNLLLVIAVVTVLRVRVSGDDEAAWGGLMPSAVVASVALLTAAVAVEVRRFLGAGWHLRSPEDGLR
jgi:hypothetical protein